MKYVDYYPYYPNPFRILSMEEFNRLSTDERAAYLRKAVEHLRLAPKQRQEPG